MDKEIDMPVEFNLENARISLIFDKAGFEKKFDFVLGYHHHPAHEFFLVKRGDLIIKIDGEDYFVKSDSFAAIPSGTSHTVFWRSENAQIKVMRLEFYKNSKKNAKIKSDIFGLLNKLLSWNSKPYIFSECSDIIEKFESLSNDLKNLPLFLHDEYLNRAAFLFAVKIIYYMNEVKFGERFTGKYEKISENNIFPKKQSYTDIIEKYISDLPNKKILLSELTSELNLSKSQTIRLINQIYNAKFSDVILNTRMNAAKSMILDTELTFEKISEYLGYTYNGFLRAFKKATGKTPSEFKQNK